MIITSKFTFIAVPKCASTSIEAALLCHAQTAILTPLADQHMSGTDYRNRYGGRQKTVAITRPLRDWLASFHRYLGGKEWNGTQWSTAEFGFASFVQRWLHGDKMWPEPYHTQREYLAGVDLVFPLSRLEDFEEFVCQKLGAKINLGHLNKSVLRPHHLPDHLEEALVKPD